MSRSRVLSIRHGARVAEVVPELGGALAAFFEPAPDGSRRDWLRPGTQEALDAGDPLRMASFVLVPWCNRIRDGRFDWEGRTVELAPVTAHPHALHGVGWVSPWQVEIERPDHLALALERPATPEWPFAFRAEQTYRLDDAGLAVTVSLTNRDASPMPAGIGHHPYFAHRRDGIGTRLQATVAAIWHGDPALLPTRLEADAPVVRALSAGTTVSDHVLDNNFAGFGHEAVIAWPDGSGLRMLAESPLDYFVLYSPAGLDHFCAEAVSNCTDWINLRAADPQAQVGGASLPPGATLRATTRFEPCWRLDDSSPE